VFLVRFDSSQAPTALIDLLASMLIAVEASGRKICDDIPPAIPLGLAMLDRRPSRTRFREWPLAVATHIALLFGEPVKEPSSVFAVQSHARDFPGGS
jgi:hypothetical protein